MKQFINKLLFHLGVLAGPLVIRILGLTWRIEWVGREHYRRCRDNGNAVIYTFWHGRLLPLTYTHRNRAIQILISRHSDGEIIRRVTGRLGFGAVRGSTGKGGGRAILEMAKKGREGCDLGITPDGPRGPRQKVQAGVIRIAQRSGLPILPLASAMSRGVRLASWDRFQIPAPFAKLVVGYGEPVHVPPHIEPEEVESYRYRVEEAVRQITSRVDQLAGSRENE